MRNEAAKLRQALLSRSGRKGAQERYSPELRAAIVRHARQRIQEGASQRDVADEIGLSGATLCRFLRQDRGSQFHQVELKTSERTRGGLRIKTQSGLTIEGLDLSALVGLIRGLE